VRAKVGWGILISGERLEIAEHLLTRAATGECDFDRLKASAFNKLMSQ
jgi:hypothetical protein